MKQMMLDIGSGTSFADALKKSGILSGIDTHMAVVGIRTGTLDSVMRKIASRAEDEAVERIGNMISVIGPTLVAALSTVVGVIILSVMLPLMGIMSTLI